MERRKSPRIKHDELTDEQLDRVSGGSEVVKLGKITVEGKREKADPVYHIAKMEVSGKKSS